MAGGHAAARPAALVTAVAALALVVCALKREILAAGSACVQLIALAWQAALAVLAVVFPYSPQVCSTSPSPARERGCALACCWCCRAEAGKRFRQQV
jgi:hypothetical protein